ncbi:hypothetical protein K435DRAFT_641055 [Dendrothele bispora CBS 962.96]|uniref:Diphthamide biosynthesis protein 4 n=1 Tax=Dendrothele bispora (strain CBS 962.96) TaxID=1314807 RepID=A0A4S8MYH0_DENBC|nr:hypothetical protein K435DRAFT_641055 [Dendrothele bispora CBS 962.96]
MDPSSTFIDFYQILSILPTSSLPQIKSAYHRALLKHHPDKQINHRSSSVTEYTSISTIKQAYLTLSDPVLRAEYDATYNHARNFLGGTGPRPAQLISLSDFTESSPSSFDFFEYTYPCRCGGIYRINEAQMERGDHLVGCESCSEVVWVGFEAVTGDEDEEHELG